MSESSPSHGRQVSLVIPGRNCAATIRACLDAVTAIARQQDSALREIIFVNDSSSDSTPDIVTSFPDVRMLHGPGRGPAIARNIGWQAAQHPLNWFIDADCIAEPDALAKLLPHFADASVGGVGGSYGIVNDRRRLARLVHEEIVERHRRMRPDVNFLASFNVLYRAAALRDAGGFDERYTVPSAEDAHLSFAVQDAGWRLRFEPDSRVGHHHPEHLGRYLRTQARHGYWRVLLHMEHRGHGAGDSYSSLLDHLQPILAIALLVSLIAPLLARVLPDVIPPVVAAAPLLIAATLLAATVPMTVRLLRRTRRAEMLWYALLSATRAVWRGLGLTAGVIRYVVLRRHRPSRSSDTVAPATPEARRG